MHPTPTHPNNPKTNPNPNPNPPPDRWRTGLVCAAGASPRAAIALPASRHDGRSKDGNAHPAPGTGRDGPKPERPTSRRSRSAPRVEAPPTSKSTTFNREVSRGGCAHFARPAITDSGPSTHHENLPLLRRASHRWTGPRPMAAFLLRCLPRGWTLPPGTSALRHRRLRQASAEHQERLVRDALRALVPAWRSHCAAPRRRTLHHALTGLSVGKRRVRAQGGAPRQDWPRFPRLLLVWHHRDMGCGPRGRPRRRKQGEQRSGQPCPVVPSMQQQTSQSSVLTRLRL
jgi:hypothetical protein